jgi:hypothetical protein
MAFTPTAIVQNQAFAQVQFGVAILPKYQSPIVLSCQDNQGNTIKKTIVEVDASAGGIDVMLPSIESLANDLDCEIDFIITDGTSAINILANFDYILGTPPVDTIGQTGTLNIPPATYTAGAVLTFRPAYEGYWSYSVTKN